MMVEKIISGGQTGADQGALNAAHALGIPTSGWMPQGFLTETGPRPDIAQTHNLIEHSSAQYTARTLSNLLYADGTLIFGTITSGGSKQTYYLCQEHNRPVLHILWARTKPITKSPIFYHWLLFNKIKILNVAGNRESKNPGITRAVEKFLILNLSTESNAN